MEEDERYMRQAIGLAYKGLGDTYPNPAVGCVIVAGGEIIGRGYHCRAGEPHAEVNAVSDVADKSLLKNSTLYVTLEPCAHYGKTPPCADMIVECGIPRVVIGTVDPFAQVNGLGIEKLRQAGVKVTLGVLEGPSRELNKRFFTYHECRRPYVFLKWAQTADGYIDRSRTDRSIPPLRITGPQVQKYVHEMRSREQAILVGTRTALLDNPRLDARLAEHPRHPLRVVLDRWGQVPADFHVLDGMLPTLVFTQEKRTDRPNLVYCPLDFSGDVIGGMLDELYRRGIQSLLVEGGAVLLNGFFTAGLWDEAYVFSAPWALGGGVDAPVLPLSARQVESKTLGEDSLAVYKNILV